MDVNTAIRRMMKTTGMSGRAVSTRIGRYQDYLSSSLYNAKDHKVEVLAEIARAMDYELVLEGHNERIVLGSSGEDHSQTDDGVIG